MDEFALRWFFGLGFGAGFGCVCVRLGKVGGGGVFLLLDEIVKHIPLKNLLNTISMCFFY